MIDLFSLANIKPDEPLIAVHRSHGVRLVFRLVLAAFFLVGPFFFLFDVRGWGWLAILLSWVGGLALLWLAFDVWSTSLILITNDRLIGAERVSWGRVRVHDWRLTDVKTEPQWKAWRVFPWLGVTRWQRVDGSALTLSWMRPFSGQDLAKTRKDTRKKMIARIQKADATLLDALETFFDAQDRS
ncbi:hypothetical protein KBB27_01965 [Patescibacteria group bacterium]|nr:hypothetical protein [Patescibacteria group bacterium]